MTAAEIHAWIEKRPPLFREQRESLAWNAKEERVNHGCSQEYLLCRREARLFLRGGLYADGQRVDPDCLNTVLDQLEAEA